MTWRTAHSLDVVLAEINAHAPNRSKISDGSIGDTAHSARTSDHNPNKAGVVRARDFTHDPHGGLDCNVLAARLADMLRAGTHPALGSGAYIIWNRTILSRDRIAEGWRPYSGTNPHTKHLHLSVATKASGYDSTVPWNLFAPPAPAVKRRPKPIRDAIKAAQAALVGAGPVRAERVKAAIRELRKVKKQ
ncbi:hypothetical protein ACFJIY_07705 [Pimelobacter simplex]|uniref:hypothetical protein n=1 Tax=Nocardioides simplex TaxID=2045 RepID=UPI00366CCF85